MVSLRYTLSVAAALCMLSAHDIRAQQPTMHADLHDSIDVSGLVFAGATNVSSSDLKRVIFTRATTCRLVFIAPLCKLTGSQLVNDRRRTTPSALGEDITKLRVYYWQRGYRSAQVDTVLAPSGRGTQVTFRIAEGPPTVVSPLVVRQRTSVLTDAEVNEAVTLHDGDALSLIALDTTLSRLHTAVWNKGYGDVTIDTTAPGSDAQHRIALTIDIDPRYLTRVGDVHFEGNAALSDAALRRGVVLFPGELYTRDRVLESQKRLFQSPALARALVITPPSGDSIKSITVAITEVAPHHAELTAGFNTIEYGQAAADLRLNSLGSARWLSLRAAVGNLLADQLNGRAIFRDAGTTTGGGVGALSAPTYQITATLTQPWIAGPRTSAAITGFAGRRAVPNVVVDEDFGATVGIVHERDTQFPVGLSYRLESTRVQASAVYFCAGYGICDAGDRDALVKRQRLAPIGLSAWIDRSDDLEVPTTGYTAVVDAEHASSITGSTFAHSRISANGSWYKSIGSAKIVQGIEGLPKVLALHGRFGFVRPSADRSALGLAGTGEGILHPRARFYAGGMQSVRGFAENELGPQILQVRRSSLVSAGCSDASIRDGSCDPSAVPGNEFFARPLGGSSVLEASAELRVPIVKALGGVAFLDGAYVGTAGLASPGKAKGAVTPGFGFRYRSPLGVLRLDFGLRPTGHESLPVAVAVTDPVTGNDSVVILAREKSYSILDPSPGFLRSIGRRIVVHFAMGQAF